MFSSDASSLRKTIRLIHSLQKERGATCTAAAALESLEAKIQEYPSFFDKDGKSIDLNSNAGCTENNIAACDENEETVHHKSPSRKMAHPNLDKNVKMLVEVMYCTRRKTDREIACLSTLGISRSKKTEAPFREALERIRNLVVTTVATPKARSSAQISSCLPQSRDATSPSSTSNFRRIFMAFNALIVHIIHEKIVVMNTLSLQRSLKASALPTGSDIPFQGSRARADTSPNRDDVNTSLQTSPMQLGNFERQDSFNNNLQKPIKHSRMAASADAKFYDKLFPYINSNKLKDNNGSTGKDTTASFSQQNTQHQHKLSSRKPPLPMNSIRTSNDEEKEKEKSRNTKDQFRTKSLLSLLLSFVQLKESTSIERAFLTSLLSMSETKTNKSTENVNDIDSEIDTTTKSKAFQKPKRLSRRSLSQDGEKLVNDLVMEMENQHLMTRKLRKKAQVVEEMDKKEGYGWSILKLVEQSVEMCPELAELHNLIRQNFDMETFCESTTMEKFWGMITFYIDRLHALELLIVEEIESCSTPSPPSPVETVSSPVVSISSTLNTNDLPVSDPETAPSPLPSVHSSRAPSIDNDVAVFDRTLLLSALSDEKEGRSFDIAPVEAQKVLNSMPPHQLKQCILSMFGNASPRNSSDDDIFSLSDDGSLFENVPTQSYTETAIPTEIEIKEKALDEPPHKEWLIDLYQVSFVKRIARGCAGTTYVGQWQNQQVAIKVAAMTQMGVEGWGTEVRSLQRLHHPNIIRFYGAIYNDHPRTHCLVLEYCDRGDLTQALQMEQLPNNFFEIASLSMANGMAYLHTKNILHRDIKPGNILVHGDLERGDFSVKLTDFGLATMTRSDDEHTAETGTYRWMAPEVIRHECYSYQADVYSFSIVVWQLLTREIPFSGYSQVQAATMVALDHARPPFPQGTPDVVKTLISQGWNKDAKVRPGFENIVKRLEEFKQNLSFYDKEWLQAPQGHRVYVPQPPDIVRKGRAGQKKGKRSFFVGPRRTK